MSRTLIAVAPSARLEDVQRVFDERDISAVAVLDEFGSLRGILSTKDLLGDARIEMAAPGVVARIRPAPRTAADLMRTNVLTIDEGAPLAVAAATMLRKHVHRLIVLREGRPAGVISTRDAMRAIVSCRVTVPLGEVMTREVETLDGGDPVDLAVERLDDANVRGLVVVDATWPIGVFTHTEALHARALPPPLRKMPVERVMSYETICLDVSTPVYRVASYARQMNVRRVLGVEHRGLRGIASGFDLLRVMLTGE